MYQTEDLTDEQAVALRRFEEAQKQLFKCLSKKGGGAAGENNYSDAYQKLVQLGLRPPIRGKYRKSAHGRDNMGGPGTKPSKK